MSEKGFNIDCNFKSITLDVNEICEEIKRNIKSTKNIPEVILTTQDKEMHQKKKLSWNTYRLSPKRKEKYTNWIETVFIPSLENHQNALSNHNKYEKFGSK